ncbi:MAG: polysaccharide deacetylase family protein [Eubacteriales bacterium]
MSKTVTIPNDGTNPFVVMHNGVKYTYEPGATVTVPDGVALEIEEYKRWREKYFSEESAFIDSRPDLSQNDSAAKNFVKGRENVIFRPETAEVGQTIVVKELDENGKPVDWKAVEARGNWNQNDSTQPDYIYNRTHKVEEVFVPSFTLMGVARTAGAILKEFEVIAVEGTHTWEMSVLCRVSYDSPISLPKIYIPPYVIDEYSASGYGDPSLFGNDSHEEGNSSIKDNGLDIAIAQNRNDTNGWTIRVSKDSKYFDYQDITLEFGTYEKVYSPLDENYIPTTVPRVESASVGDILKVKSVDDNGKPTEWEAQDMDGITPHIGDNGNWYIGDTDTGVKAQGEDGSDANVTAENIANALGYTPASENDLEFYATKEWATEQIEKATGSTTPEEDLIPKRTTSLTSNGITFTPIDNGEGGYQISGTSTAVTSYAIFKDTIPDGFVVGEKYIVDANTTYDIFFTVTAYNADSVSSEIYNSSTATSTEFTIPMDAVTIAFRAGVRSGSTVDEVFIPHVYAAPKVQYPNPMLTIIDDDGYQKFATLLLPIIQAKKVPIGTAVIGQRVGEETSAMNMETLKNCAVAGAEILSHSWCHMSEARATDLEQYEIQYDYQMMKNFLLANGLKSNGFVFAGNSASLPKCVNAAKMVYDYGILPDCGSTNQKYSTNRYGIERWSIDPNDTLTTENLQSMLDELATAGTGWMIWMIHTSDSDFQQDQADIISDAIDYARSKGIDIVTTEYGVKQYVVD